MCTEKYQETAQSFAGCDGGNLDSEIWFCGMEWGFHGEMKDGELADECLVPQYRHGGWNDTLEKWDDDAEKSGWEWEDSLASPTNAKIGWFLNDYFNLGGFCSENDWLVKNKLFFNDPKGIGFKLNMFPLPLRGRANINWSDEIKEKTGFGSFDQYRIWTVQNRGKFFQNLLHQHKPKRIICTGISEFENFCDFWGIKDFSTGKWIEGITTNTTFWVGENDKTQIIVTRFFGGRWGVSSYSMMEELVRSIKKIS